MQEVQTLQREGQGKRKRKRKGRGKRWEKFALVPLLLA
jgi:hypothetical protein